MEQNLNWILSSHIKNQNYEEVEIVIKQMSTEELQESKKSIEIFLSSSKAFNRFKAGFRVKDSQLNAKDFLKKKLEIINKELNNRI